MTTGYDRNGNRDNAAHGFQAQAEQISRRLGESAQTVWLAGLGALGRVQSEGGKLFDSLVREGAAYERTGQRKAAESVDELRDEVETQFEQARDTAVRGWDKLGKAFDERVKGVLRTLNIPEQEELENLRREVESLKAQVRANTAATKRANRTANQAAQAASGETTAAGGPVAGATSASGNPGAFDPE
ncbi:phasin family protein [Xanthomonas vasicola]|uniref:Poly(Hydroxyalcanoate) granule associated protein n=1 Tax=Xanthomonas vasicola pv. vasculorum NCPPB 890 TaxID=1184265 RepID=A0A836P750_XANVA|nr:phasin family protein [Xanthomonas vasicola]AZR26329.1 poly(hydroxyalcanoate) granule associated protein [Xanthomonas vasicola pv. arecae]AZR31399.1 poly(hydroxyalcanoate) granule associated protein [Xanthomonas vasicola pv. musacearum NCPPB 4379]AZR34540.1 poly(hydroxyalcanoate) granule associated protein [Xanthomonas vasicola]KEZ96790.1 poly(hydroxyalcanoate) granule associated protein [Xanthomonas vasicola pv. vasculorum NCPPB 895]KFA13482.1 poly(hydroxyalcanoate) granule associated prot